jgi:hypothetical protein
MATKLERQTGKMASKLKGQTGVNTAELKPKGKRDCMEKKANTNASKVKSILSLLKGTQD